MEQIEMSQQQTPLPATSLHALLQHPDIVQIHERFECKMANMQKQVVAMIQDIYGFLADEIALVTVQMLAVQQQQQQQTRKPPEQNCLVRTTTRAETESNVSTPQIGINAINRNVTMSTDHNNITLNSMETTPQIAAKPTNGDANVDHNRRNNNNNIAGDRTSTDQSQQQQQSQIAKRKRSIATAKSRIKVNQQKIDSSQSNRTAYDIGYGDQNGDNVQVSDILKHQMDENKDNNKKQIGSKKKKSIDKTVDKDWKIPGGVVNYNRRQLRSQLSPVRYNTRSGNKRISTAKSTETQETTNNDNISVANVVTLKDEPDDDTEEVPLSWASKDVDINRNTLVIDRENEMDNDEDEYNEIEQDDLERGEKMDDEEKTLRYRVETVSLRCLIGFCNHIAENKRMLLLHQREEHDLGAFQCVVCVPIHSFDNSEHYRDHIESVHKSATADFRCKQCRNLKFRTFKEFRMHKYRYHEIGVFRCTAPDCPFEQSIRQNVFDHIRNKHTQYVCSYNGCVQKFSEENLLRQHELIHLKARPFACIFSDECRYTSRWRGQVIQHVRSAHFRLPWPEWKQRELNIVDERDPNVYVRDYRELLN